MRKSFLQRASEGSDEPRPSTNTFAAFGSSSLDNNTSATTLFGRSRLVMGASGGGPSGPDRLYTPSNKSPDAQKQLPPIKNVFPLRQQMVKQEPQSEQPDHDRYADIDEEDGEIDEQRAAAAPSAPPLGMILDPISVVPADPVIPGTLATTVFVGQMRPPPPVVPQPQQQSSQQPTRKRSASATLAPENQHFKTTAPDNKAFASSSATVVTASTQSTSNSGSTLGSGGSAAPSVGNVSAVTMPSVVLQQQAQPQFVQQQQQQQTILHQQLQPQAESSPAAKSASMDLSGSASDSSSAKTSLPPKAALYTWCNRPPLRVALSESNYITWDNEGRPHEKKYTCVFCNPLTGECFLAGRHGDSKLYSVDGATGIVWYMNKKMAQHGAAAVAYDCLLHRAAIQSQQPPPRPDNRLSDEEPYLEPNPIVFCPSFTIPQPSLQKIEAAIHTATHSTTPLNTTAAPQTKQPAPAAAASPQKPQQHAMVSESSLASMAAAATAAATTTQPPPAQPPPGLPTAAGFVGDRRGYAVQQPQQPGLQDLLAPHQQHQSHQNQQQQPLFFQRERHEQQPRYYDQQQQYQQQQQQQLPPRRYYDQQQPPQPPRGHNPFSGPRRDPRGGGGW